MTDLGWEFTKVLIAYAAGFGAVLGLCAFGLWRMGPPEDLEDN